MTCACSTKYTGFRSESYVSFTFSVLVEVLAGGAKADRLGLVLLPVRAQDPPCPRHVLRIMLASSRALIRCEV